MNKYILIRTSVLRGQRRVAVPNTTCSSETQRVQESELAQRKAGQCPMLLRAAQLSMSED